MFLYNQRQIVEVFLLCVTTQGTDSTDFRTFVEKQNQPIYAFFLMLLASGKLCESNTALQSIAPPGLNLFIRQIQMLSFITFSGF